MVDYDKRFAEFDLNDAIFVEGAHVGMGFSPDGQPYGVVIISGVNGPNFEKTQTIFIIPPATKSEFLKVIKALEDV